MDVFRNSANFPILKTGLALTFVCFIGYRWIAQPFFFRKNFKEQHEIAEQVYQMQLKNRKELDATKLLDHHE